MLGGEWCAARPARLAQVMAVLRKLHQLQGVLKANGGVRTSIEELTSKGGAQRQEDEGRLQALLQAVAGAKEEAADAICGPHKRAAAEAAPGARGGGSSGAAAAGAAAASSNGEQQQQVAEAAGGWQARLLGELRRLGAQALNALAASLVLMLALWAAGRLPHQR
jgi:hypothetical protein